MVGRKHFLNVHVLDNFLKNGLRRLDCEYTGVSSRGGTDLNVCLECLQRILCKLRSGHNNSNTLLCL